MKRFFKTIASRQAQAVIEMAAFGSIIIFLIGTIVQQGASSAQQQNQQLQALRIALLKSYESTQADSGARMAGSFMLVEDRLAQSVGKYGAMDRQVYLVSGAGVMTDLLYRTIDWEDLPRDIPVMDMSINGQDFVLTQAAKVIYTLNGGVGFATITANVPDGLSPDVEMQNSMNPAHKDAQRLGRDFSTTGGFQAFQSVVVNSERWGQSVGSENDLNRDGIPDTIDSAVQAKIPWQWFSIDLRAAKTEIDQDKGEYPSYDVDSDRVEETLYKVVGTGGRVKVYVLDWNAGDVDNAADPNEYENFDDVPGLKPEMELFTNVSSPGNSYLEIKEGALFDPATKNRVGSVSKKNQVDLISRKFVLNPRMIGGGSLCDASNNPKQAGVEACCQGAGCCSSGANAGATCVEWMPGYGKKVLYIRSRVRDDRAHGWITAVPSADIGDRSVFK